MFHLLWLRCPILSSHTICARVWMCVVGGREGEEEPCNAVRTAGAPVTCNEQWFTHTAMTATVMCGCVWWEGWKERGCAMQHVLQVPQ